MENEGLRVGSDHVPRRGRQRVLRVLSKGGEVSILAPVVWRDLVEQGNTSSWKGLELTLA